MMTVAFDQFKRESLRKLQMEEDKSPKGSIDLPIVELIRMINAHPNYVTSSSCSGRIAVFCGASASSNGHNATNTTESNSTSDHLITKGGKWLIAEHATVTMEEFQHALQSASRRNNSVLSNKHDADVQTSDFVSNMVIFKHEPFIMHVVCRDIESAKEMLQCGIACGFRESGIVVGNKKIMCAIRTNANAMEIPLGHSVDHLMVNLSYLQWILDIANEKFRANEKKTSQFTKAITTRLLNNCSKASGDQQLDFHKSSVSCRNVKLFKSPNTEGKHFEVQRVGHSSVMYNNTIYVFGGQGLSSTTATVSRLNDLLTISSKGNVLLVTTTNPSPSPRMHHTAVMIYDDMIVFGGRAGPLTCYNDIHILDCSTHSWRKVNAIGALPSPRWKHTASVVGPCMYVFGGRNADTVFNDLYCLDMSDSNCLKWRLIDVSPSPALGRFDHVGVTFSKTKLLFWGGMSSVEMINSTSTNTFVSVFDTMNEKWEVERQVRNPTCGPLSTAIACASCVVQDVHIIVGSNQTLYSLCTLTMEWNTLTKISVDGMEGALIYATASWIPIRSAVVLVGGGFQCFGFGQVYSSSFECNLIITDKSSKTKSKISQVKDEDKSMVSSNVPTPSTFPLGVLAEKTQVKAIKTLLEHAQVYDKSRRVRVAPEFQEGDSSAIVFLLPVASTIFTAQVAHKELVVLKIVDDRAAFINKSGTGTNRNDIIRNTLSKFAKDFHMSESTVRSLSTLPLEFIGVDVLLVPRDAFLGSEWDMIESCHLHELWSNVCLSTMPRLTRVVRKAFIDTSEKRQSRMEMLYVDPTFTTSRPSAGWVQVRENGIWYNWDLTRVMFSSGNVTEKARMGRMNCTNEVIVDLFAGIGYYVLPFLVHAGAAFVHACEWNPDSVEALRYNLEQNHVSSRCQIYEGDNQFHAPTIGSVADRVNLGLLPTSEKAWPLAVQVLKPSGGWLHVHDNVAVEDKDKWTDHVVKSIQTLAMSHGRQWIIQCTHVERVKSYAPKVYHYVADIHCSEQQ